MSPINKVKHYLRAKKDTKNLQESVGGVVQDRIYAGKSIPPQARSQFPGLKEPGDYKSAKDRYQEIEAINGNPAHYQTHCNDDKKNRQGRVTGKSSCHYRKS